MIKEQTRTASRLMSSTASCFDASFSTSLELKRKQEFLHLVLELRKVFEEAGNWFCETDQNALTVNLVTLSKTRNLEPQAQRAVWKSQQIYRQSSVKF